jgi:peptide/nickel transport system permease protein
MTNKSPDIKKTNSVAYKPNAAFVTFMKRLFKEKPLGVAGAIIVLIVLFIGIFADFLAPYEINDTNMKAVMKPPSTEFLLGTDNLGRDMLSRIILGSRISIAVGLFGSILEVLVGIFIGFISGYFGGKVDLILQRFVDAIIIFPNLFFCLAVIAVIGPGLTQVILVLGFLGGVASSRIIRSAVMQTKLNMYIDAAQAMGVPHSRVLIKHILPNVMAPIIIIFSVAMGAMIIGEASLSFLGFGVPPPAPSWGGMLSGSGRKYMISAPWMAIWPGLFLSILVFGVNMLGDGVRDLLDPRLRGGVGGLGEYGIIRAKKALEKKQKFIA